MTRFNEGDEVLCWTVVERDLQQILLRWEYKGLKENIISVFYPLDLEENCFCIFKNSVLPQLFIYNSFLNWGKK